MKMQDKVMATIRDLVERHSMEVVESWAFSNSGILYIQKPNNLTTKFRIAVQFNDGYCTIGVVRNDETICNGCASKGTVNSNDAADPRRERSFFHLSYHEGDRLAAMQNAIQRECRL